MTQKKRSGRPKTPSEEIDDIIAGETDWRKVFNTRLDSKTVRAVDVFEGSPIDESAMRKILLEAVKVNSSGKGKP